MQIILKKFIDNYNLAFETLNNIYLCSMEHEWVMNRFI